MGIETISNAELYIGKRVLAARVRRCLSQEWLASRLGITTEQLDDYEQGIRALPIDRLDDVAQLLRVDISYFYAGLNGAEAAHLSDEAYRVLKRALQHIAADHVETRNGRRKRLPRHEAIRVAREACEALGWDYSKAIMSIESGG